MFSKGPGGTYTAVDFDARRLRVVQLEVNGKRLRVKKMHSVDMPADVSLSDPQAVGAFLGTVLKDLRLAGAGILMHVPRGQAVLKPLSLPNVEADEDLPGMVRYQVEKELPFSGDQAVIDFALENHFDAENPNVSSDGRLDVLVAAVHQRVVDHYRQIAEAAGTKIRRLGLRPYANMCCIEACRVIEPGHCVAVVHITSDETEIDVFSDQAVHFSRAAVVKLADSRGSESEATPSAEAAASTDKAVQEQSDQVEQLVTEVTRSLKSYHAVQRGRVIRKILVAGDTGVELPVVRRLAMEFDVPCARFSPAAGLELENDDADDSAYISAFGLAIGQGDRGPAVPFDFLNPKKPVQRVDPRKRNMVIGGVAAALVLGVTVFATASHISSKRSELNDLVAESNALSREVRTGKSLLGRVNAVEKWTDASRNWLAHWTQISALFPPATEAYITSMRSSAETSINLALRARTSETITALGERLTEAGYEFRPGPVTTVNDPHGYVYNTTIRVIIDPKMKIDLDAIPAVERPSDDASAEVLNGESRGSTATASRSASPAPQRPAPANAGQRPNPRERPALPAARPRPSTEAQADASQDDARDAAREREEAARRRAEAIRGQGGNPQQRPGAGSPPRGRGQTGGERFQRRSPREGRG